MRGSRWLKAAPHRPPTAGSLVAPQSGTLSTTSLLAREATSVSGCSRSTTGEGTGQKILRQSLVIAGTEGGDRALVTCDEGNVASATVIERCGGVLESVIEGSEGVRKRRYWIQLSIWELRSRSRSGIACRQFRR